MKKPLEDDGLLAWRDEEGHRRSPVFTGYESERSLIVGGRVVSEIEAYRIAAGVAESDRQHFAGGWRAAASGRGPATWHDEQHPAWTTGYNAYPRPTFVDPYAGFTEEYQKQIRMQDQDEVTRDIKRKAKKAKRRTA